MCTLKNKCSPFTVYIVVQNVQFVHYALYKSYSLYKPCVHTL